MTSMRFFKNITSKSSLAQLLVGGFSIYCFVGKGDESPKLLKIAEEVFFLSLSIERLISLRNVHCESLVFSCIASVFSLRTNN